MKTAEDFYNELDQANIEETMYTLSRAIFECAHEKGWWDEGPRHPGEVLMNIVAEVAEGWEGVRKDLDSDKIEGFTSLEEELADVIIRILDYSCARQLRTPEAILAKMEYNLSRSYRHGGKKY